MAEEKEEVVEITLSAASPLSVEDAGKLPQALKNLIQAAASKIVSAEQKTKNDAEAARLKREQHDQSKAGRRERQAKAAAK